MDKVEMLKAFFASIFNTEDGLKRSQHPELEDCDYENGKLWVNPEGVRDLLLQLDPYRSMGYDRINVRIHKELADTITRHLLIIFEQSWESGDVLVFNEGVKDDPGSYRPVSLTPVPGKIMEMMIIILGGIGKHLKDNTVIGHKPAYHERKVLLFKTTFLLC